LTHRWFYRLQRVIVIALLFAAASPVQGQEPKFSLLIKGGHVIDPKNGIDGVMDVAVADGKVARVASNIEASSAGRVADATGLYVVPGLIDLHAHVFLGNGGQRSLQ